MSVKQVCIVKCDYCPEFISIEKPSKKDAKMEAMIQGWKVGIDGDTECPSCRGKFKDAQLSFMNK